MRIQSSICILIDMVFISSEQIKCDIVAAALDCHLEELDAEFSFGFLKELDGKAELSAKDEDLEYLILDHILFVVLKELHNV